MISVRERLAHSVIGDCNGRHPPLGCLFYYIGHLGYTIHIAHLGMTVKLHSFHIGIVHSLDCEIRDFLDSPH